MRRCPAGIFRAGSSASASTWPSDVVRRCEMGRSSTSEDCTAGARVAANSMRETTSRPARDQRPLTVLWPGGAISTTVPSVVVPHVGVAPLWSSDSMDNPSGVSGITDGPGDVLTS